MHSIHHSHKDTVVSCVHHPIVCGTLGYKDAWRSPLPSPHSAGPETCALTRWCWRIILAFTWFLSGYCRTSRSRINTLSPVSRGHLIHSSAASKHCPYFEVGRTLGWSRAHDTISKGGPSTSWWSQAPLTQLALKKHDPGCLWGVGSDMWVAGCWAIGWQ